MIFKEMLQDLLSAVEIQLEDLSVDVRKARDYLRTFSTEYEKRIDELEAERDLLRTRMRDT